MSKFSIHPGIPLSRGGFCAYLNPESSQWTLTDIAQGLARTARFCGQTTTYYSVAQHCVGVSHLVPHEDAAHALLHDAAEAFMGDLPTPLKQLLPEYVAIEKALQDEILRSFGVAPANEVLIKRADLIRLRTEVRDLLPQHAADWPTLAGIEPERRRIIPWTEKQARGLFLRRARALQIPLLPQDARGRAAAVMAEARKIA